MSSAGAIRAGEAYVEITSRDAGLNKGLARAMAKLRAFGAGLSGLGIRLGLVGAAATAPMLAAVKAFARTGTELSAFQRMTGLSGGALNGIAEAARRVNAPIETVSMGIRKMQRTIEEGTPKSAAAFARLGTSAAELAKMSPDQAIGLLADRLDMMTEGTEKAAIAQEIFGRSGTELIPVLAGGTAALNAHAAAAQRLGTAFNDKALADANRLQNGFVDLGDSVTGLGNAFAQAVAGPLADIVQGLTNVLVNVQAFVAANPTFVQAVGILAPALLGLSGAFFVLGTAITLCTMPGFVFVAMTAMILAEVTALTIGLAVLTDTLGMTQTGWGDMFNAIRIGGTGLGTWLSVIFTYAAAGANVAWEAIELGWDATVHGIKKGIDLLAGFFDWMSEGVIKAFKWAIDGIVKGLNVIITMYNKIQTMLGLSTTATLFATPASLQAAINRFEGKRQKRNTDIANSDADYVEARDEKEKLFAHMREVMKKKISDAFIVDEDKGDKAKAPQNGWSTPLFENAAKKVVEGLEADMTEILKKIADLFNPGKFKTPEAPPFTSKAGALGAAGAGAMKPRDSTFLEANLSRLAIGSKATALADAADRNTKTLIDLAQQQVNATKENHIEVG